jgi:hypothetical protein
LTAADPAVRTADRGIESADISKCRRIDEYEDWRRCRDPCEMANVEREQVRHVMSVTDGDQASVMNLLADDGVRFHDDLPGGKDIRRFRQQRKVGKEIRRKRFRFGR